MLGNCTRLTAAALGAGLGLLLGVGWIRPQAAEGQPAQPERTLWVEEPACQMVFFAVLEGLYTDGVSSEVVDLILRPDPKTGAPRKQEHFVVCCPLCEPAYEAFVLYRSRQLFSLKGQGVDTFGPGLEPAMVARLRSEKKAERLDAIQTLLNTWVRRRIASLRLGRVEQADLARKLDHLRNEGMESLKKLQSGGQQSGYADWKSCPVCEGSAGACPKRD